MPDDQIQNISWITGDFFRQPIVISAKNERSADIALDARDLNELTVKITYHCEVRQFESIHCRDVEGIECILGLQRCSLHALVYAKFQYGDKLRQNLKKKL